ncbi:cytidylyltransferase family domain-containing protein [Ditylenchus destructor]|nr:cytidylyltransferase family domain-containing protein [Ditylenchus destructor]
MQEPDPSEGDPNLAEGMRQRRAQQMENLSPADAQDQAGVSAAPSDDDDDDPARNEERLEHLRDQLPQASDTLGSLLDSQFSTLSSRWRNWVVRGILSIVMISCFWFIVRRGATWLMIGVFLIQFKCFKEIINIGLAVYRLYDLPWFRALSWYFLVTSNYFFFGEGLIDYWSIVLHKDEFLHSLVVHHRIISFTMYIIGFVWFVLSLHKGFYLRQFSLFAWTHVTLLLIVSQSYLIIQNLLQGLIWFLVPVSMIICCDIMSYIFGFFWGKTPLIKLSPKKTWEGFIGGAFSTIIFGLVLSSILMKDPFYVCPIESYIEDNMNCTIPYTFQLHEYDAPRMIAWVYKLLKKPAVINIQPFLGHSIILALFASLIGPFGGFFASGFKRAFKIKDFGDIIPGHGGLMDRFDCQLLMGTFVNVYIHSFIRYPSWKKIVQQIMWLPADEQKALYEALQQELQTGGII